MDEGEKEFERVLSIETAMYRMSVDWNEANARFRAEIEKNGDTTKATKLRKERDDILQNAKKVFDTAPAWSMELMDIAWEQGRDYEPAGRL